MKKEDIKNVVVLGDSYSTFLGYIPKSYAYYYPRHDVLSVDDTWWKLLQNELNFNIVLNCSYSGSTVCYTGYDGAYVKDTSFIERIKNSINTGKVNDKNVDTVIIFGGTNDSWANVPMGEINYLNQTEKDLECFLPSFCYLINFILDNLKSAKILVVINSEVIRNDVINAEKEICKHYNVDYVALKEFSTLEGHPDKEGMQSIKDQILSCLL